MISRRGFLAGLLALPIVAKLEPIARAVLPRLPGRLGVKGQEFLEAGYVWAPYIPVVYTTTILELIVRERMHKEDYARYSERRLRPENYGVVKF